jgi:hypothetical protein
VCARFCRSVTAREYSTYNNTCRWINFADTRASSAFQAAPRNQIFAASCFQQFGCWHGNDKCVKSVPKALPLRKALCGIFMICTPAQHTCPVGCITLILLCFDSTCYFCAYILTFQDKFILFSPPHLASAALFKRVQRN